VYFAKVGEDFIAQKCDLSPTTFHGHDWNDLLAKSATNVALNILATFQGAMCLHEENWSSF
jgi:hypothetical protein